jgi:hypothetical protein
MQVAASGQGNGQYLVVWQSGLAENADIYGCRLDESGKALDAKPFLISGAKECQERPRVVWGKGSWLVVWEDIRNDTDFDVYAARVTPEGKVLDPDGILVAGGEHNQCSPDAAFNGDSFLVVWRSYGPCQKGAPISHGQYRVYGARVTPDGKVVDSQPLALTDLNFHWSITTSEPPRVALCNAAGFGGTNSCLVLRFA